MGEGNVFTRVCLFTGGVFPLRGGVCLPGGCLLEGVGGILPSEWVYMEGYLHEGAGPPLRYAKIRVNQRLVRIQLECILVFYISRKNVIFFLRFFLSQLTTTFT